MKMNNLKVNQTFIKRFLVALFIFSGSILMAQDHGHESTSHEISNPHAVQHGKNFILFEYGYTHIMEGVKHGEHDEHPVEQGHWVSSFGFDYFRLLNEKWSVGIKLDYELGHYIIPHDEPLNRENVFIVIPSVSYKVLPQWSVYGGAGIEFEGTHNLFVSRLGTEYAFALGDGWELPIGYFYDMKKGYNTYAFTIGIGKIF